MPKKRSVVRIISEERAVEILKDLRSMSLEEAGRKHGIRNVGTIPTLINSAYVRGGRKIPAALKKLPGAPAADRVISVGGKGTLIVPKEAVIDAFGFKKGRKFSVRKHGRKIILTALGRGGKG